MTHHYGIGWTGWLLGATSPGLNAPTLTQSLLLALGVAGLVLAGASLWRRSRGRRVRSEPCGIRSDESTAVAELEEAMTRLDDLSRRIHGRLDAKLATLESLIREADARIDRLGRTVPESGRQSGLDMTLPEELPDTHSRGEANAPTQSNAAVYRLADGGLTPVQIAQEVGRTTGEIELILALRRGVTASNR